MRARFDTWIARRRHLDAQQSYQQFTAQLGALGTAITQALERVQLAFDELEAQPRSAGELFAGCALNDLRLAWVQRLWFYFRHKFDQRDDPEIAPLLQAADEIVWSCYKPAFEQSGEPLRAAPLPYVEPLYAPNAILRDEPPRELLANTGDAFVRASLAALPIPVIGLPASALGAPWLLALLAHEVGHHVQADLDGGEGGRIGSFAAQLKAAAGATPNPQAWSARGREVFADVFSVLTIGAATQPVLAEILLAQEPAMRASFDSRYPAPIVRLALVRETIRQLGLDAAADPHELPLEAKAPDNLPPPQAMAMAELAALPAVAAAALAWAGPAGLDFPRLLGWSPTGQPAAAWSSPGLHADGSVVTWADSLATGHAPIAPSSLESPRLLAGAGALAWTRLVQDDDDARREDQLATLGQRLLAQIPKVREQKTRAGGPAVGASQRSFADQLMSATQEQLGDRAS